MIAWTSRATLPAGTPLPWPTLWHRARGHHARSTTYGSDRVQVACSCGTVWTARIRRTVALPRAPRRPRRRDRRPLTRGWSW